MSPRMYPYRHYDEQIDSTTFLNVLKIEPIGHLEDSIIIRIWIDHSLTIFRMLEIRGHNNSIVGKLFTFGKIYRDSEEKQVSSDTIISPKCGWDSLFIRFNTFNIFNPEKNDFSKQTGLFRMGAPLSLYHIEFKRGNQKGSYYFKTQFPFAPSISGEIEYDIESIFYDEFQPLIEEREWWRNRNNITTH